MHVRSWRSEYVRNEEILVGKCYSNGKGGIRKVTRRPPPGEYGDVCYETVLKDGRIGRKASCWIATFQGWAKLEVAEPGATAMLRVVVADADGGESYEADVPRGLEPRLLRMIAAGLLYENCWCPVEHEVYLDGVLLDG